MKAINQIKHRGFIITVYQTAQSRFGQLYFAKDNYGEPVGNQLYFKTPSEAINDQKKRLDLCIDEQ